MRSFGPMHGEKTRRHQFTVESSREDELIISIYEVKVKGQKRLAVEYYRPSLGVISGHLTVQEVDNLKVACEEFLREHA